MGQDVPRVFVKTCFMGWGSNCLTRHRIMIMYSIDLIKLFDLRLLRPECGTSLKSLLRLYLSEVSEAPLIDCWLQPLWAASIRESWSVHVKSKARIWSVLILVNNAWLQVYAGLSATQELEAYLLENGRILSPSTLTLRGIRFDRNGHIFKLMQCSWSWNSRKSVKDAVGDDVVQFLICCMRMLNKKG